MQKLLAVAPWLMKAMNENQKEQLRAAVGTDFSIVSLDALTEDQFDQVEIGFGPIPRETASKMKNLRWLQLTSAGVESFLTSDGDLRADFRLTNASGAFGEPIAEHIVAMFLCIQQQLHVYRDQQRECVWEEKPHYHGFTGSTVAVIGLGDIGLSTAQRCAALGARVLAVKRTESEKPDCVDELFFDLDDSLDLVLKKADYVALCLPHTNETKNIIDKRRLALMKDRAVIVNIGRGALIDQDALIEELKTGRLSAGLDVTTPEPLNADSPLWGIPNCLITPHISGRSTCNMPVIMQIFFENYKRYRAGEKLRNLVDFTAGY